jgi:hypothetical protein
VSRHDDDEDDVDDEVADIDEDADTDGIGSCWFCAPE